MKDDIAHIIAENLDAIEHGRITLEEAIARYPEYRDELLELLPLALAIRDLPAVSPRSSFRYAARGRILKEISARQQRPQGGRLKRVFQFTFPQFLLRPAFSLAVILVLLVATLSAGTVYAAGGALPGDALYPVKTATEEVRLTLSDDQADAALYLQFADERLEEINRLAARGRYEDLAIAAQRLDSQMESAASLLDLYEAEASDQYAQIDRLYEELEFTYVLLAALEDNLPEPAQYGINRAMQASSKGQAKIAELFPNNFPPGPPGGVPPGQSGDTPVGPPEGKPEGPQGVGPQKTPGPPVNPGQGQGQDKDKDKDKPESPGGPSQGNTPGPPEGAGPPEDVDPGPPDDRGRPEDTSTNPSGNQPAGGKP